MYLRLDRLSSIPHLEAASDDRSEDLPATRRRCSVRSRHPARLCTFSPAVRCAHRLHTAWGRCERETEGSCHQWMSYCREADIEAEGWRQGEGGREREAGRWWEMKGKRSREKVDVDK